MQPFTPPPLKILVHKLDGVEDRPFNHTLTPADIRKDAFYQKLARRNAALEWRLRHVRALVTLAAVVVFALNVLYLSPWTQVHQQAFLDQAFAWMDGQRGSALASVPVGEAVAATAIVTPPQPQPNAAAPANTAPALAAVASSPVAAATTQAPASTPVLMASAPTPTLAPTPQAAPTPQPDAANQLAAAIRALIVQQSGNPNAATGAASGTTVSNKPITVVPAITGTKSAPTTGQPVSGQRESLPVHESAPVKATVPLSIMDFFGANTAVLLSSDGGQTMRTYRVGDALPSGEVIKAIDSVNGSVTTNQRIIKKQDQK